MLATSGGRSRSFRYRAFLVLPTFVLIILFFGWPLLDVVLRSFDPGGQLSYLAPDFTLDNYVAILEKPVLRRLLYQTLWISFLTASFCMLLGFPTAYLMSRVSPRVLRAFLVIVLSTFFVSVVARLFALTVILGRQGIVNKTLMALGLGGPYDLLFNTEATIFGMVNYLLPFMIMILYAAMAEFDHTLITAARTLGASRAQVFFRVYLPSIGHSVVSGFLLVFVLSMGYFLTPAVLGGRKDTTIPVYIVRQVQGLEWGTANSAGVLLLVITVIGYVVASRKGISSPIIGARGGTHGVVEEGKLRFSLGTVLLWAVAVLSVLLLLVPLVVVIPASFDSAVYLGFPPKGLTLRWYAELWNDRTWTSAALKSVRVGIGTALLSTGLALLGARQLLRLRSGILKRLVEVIIVAPLAVPTIVIAIGIFDVQVQLQLISTESGLILAHAVIALPLAYIIIMGGLAGLDPALEAAALTMGASRLRTFWQIVVPNISSSLVASMLVCFFISWDEVVIALFQTGLDKTLPVKIYSEMITGASPAVAAIASLLIFVTLMGVGLRYAISGALRARRSVGGGSPRVRVQEAQKTV